MDLVDDCRLSSAQADSDLSRCVRYWAEVSLSHTHTHVGLVSAGLEVHAGHCPHSSGCGTASRRNPNPPRPENRERRCCYWHQNSWGTWDRSGAARDEGGGASAEGVSCWCGLTGVRCILMSSFLWEHRVREFDKRPPDGRTHEKHIPAHKEPLLSVWTTSTNRNRPELKHIKRGRSFWQIDACLNVRDCSLSFLWINRSNPMLSNQVAIIYKVLCTIKFSIVPSSQEDKNSENNKFQSYGPLI